MYVYIDPFHIVQRTYKTCAYPVLYFGSQNVHKEIDAQNGGNGYYTVLYYWLLILQWGVFRIVSLQGRVQYM